MPSTTDPVLDAVVHRALASPTRGRLLAELRNAGRPLSAQELGQAMGLHANTIRTHLTILESARLVVSSREGGGRRGRPRHLFAASDTLPSGDDAYRALAAVLAERLGQHGAAGWGQAAPEGADTETAVEEAALAWVRRWNSQRNTDATSGIEQVLGGLHELGFVSSVRGEPAQGAEVVVESCPFSDIVSTFPEVACGFHRGVLRGLVNATGELELLSVEEDRQAHRCVAALRSAR